MKLVTMATKVVNITLIVVNAIHELFEYQSSEKVS